MNSNKFLDVFNLFIECSIGSTHSFSSMLLILLQVELRLHNAVTENTKIIDQNDNWAHLQYLEAMSPKINIRLKALKELQLFK